MPHRPLLSRLLPALAALVAGCGGSSATSTTSAHTTEAQASTSSTTTGSPPPPVKHRPRHHRHPARITSTTSTVATVRSAPTPPPPGTPPPPAGLAAATGYATYELCSSQCGGAVPGALRRPLHLPVFSRGACPLSRGSAPVRPLGPLRLTVTSFIGSPWKAAQVIWISAPGYTGPVLIRGRRLGGPGPVGFGEGRKPYDELQLLVSGAGAPSIPGAGRVWPSFTRVRGPGCYAYQVDGTGFSSVIVFDAS